MKINEISALPIGHVTTIEGPKVTRELIASFSETCGSKSIPHITGSKSALSGEGKACLHGVGTLCLLNAAVEKVLVIDGEHDIVLYGYENVRFESPNREGGFVSFRFTVKKIELSRIPVSTKKMLPVTKVMFDSEAFNPETGKRIAKIGSMTVGYVDMAVSCSSS